MLLNPSFHRFSCLHLSDWKKHDLRQTKMPSIERGTVYSLNCGSQGLLELNSSCEIFHVCKKNTLQLGNSIITQQCPGSPLCLTPVSFPPLHPPSLLTLSCSFTFLSGNFHGYNFNADANSAQSIYTDTHKHAHTQKAQSFSLSVIRRAELTENKSFFRSGGLPRTKSLV